MSSVTERFVRGNFVRSSGIIIAAFLTTAITNVVLLGWLAKYGGLEVVGTWGFVNALLLYTLIIDFGFTDSLTRKTALDGTAAAMSCIVWLFSRLLLPAILLVSGIFAVAFFVPYGSHFIAGGALAIASGLFQLASNWLISVRLGNHEQFWFNVKTILRVLTQALAVFLLYEPESNSPALIFGTGLLLGSLVEALLALLLSLKFASSWRRRREHPTDFAALKGLSRGFGLTSVLQRVQQPAWQTVVMVFGGTAALGVFTIAMRIPMIINSSISEALRVLLPGLSRLQKDGEKDSLLRLIRDATLLQILVVVPLCFCFLTFNSDFFIIWLGEANPLLLESTRIITIGIAIQSIGVPYFWALQSFGDAQKISVSTSISLAAMILLGGAALYLSDGNLVYFSYVFLATRIFNVGLMMRWCQTRWDVVFSSLKLIAFLPTVAFLAFVAVAGWLCHTLALGETPLIRLITGAGTFLTVYAAGLLLMYRKKLFHRSLSRV
ncbi:hypothetical protein JET14_09995 [Martelella lutilitoris]|uniref:Polysaccharide biosynthesis protein n=1 Tax=Martelella lutilitoris TaxID=2583532 RepID=A0A7T7HNF2_9HYPH|nr:hypothetical protein [Martelella lutilitoris]QQM32438.1 hypothetical protein JET14_09995 [Martelella lutilitoris]